MHDLMLAQRIPATHLTQYGPHSGPMVLLKEVIQWDNESITCIADSHRKANHPLRIAGILSTTQCVEYTAQAASLHATILSLTQKKPVEGLREFKPVSKAFLAVLRDFEMADGNFDDYPGDVLQLNACLAMSGPRMFQYRVKATLGDTELASGFLSLVVEN